MPLSCGGISLQYKNIRGEGWCVGGVVKISRSGLDVASLGKDTII